jgi:hypothetical protein
VPSPRLGGEEGLPHARERLRIHADALVRDRDPDIATGRQALGAGPVGVREDRLGHRRDRDGPALRHGVARVDRDVEQRRLQLRPGPAHPRRHPPALADVPAQAPVGAERAAEQLAGLRHHGRRIGRRAAARFRSIVAAHKGEHPLGDRRAAPRRFGDHPRQHADADGVFGRVLDQPGTPLHRLDGVAEVVRDAGGELAERLQPLALAQRRLRDGGALRLRARPPAPPARAARRAAPAR